MLSTVEEVVSFFAELNCGDAVNFTWDVQNLWQMGTFPSLAGYQQLRSLLAYYHLKGRQSEPGSTALQWGSGLADPHPHRASGGDRPLHCRSQDSEVRKGIPRDFELFVGCSKDSHVGHLWFTRP